VGFSNALRLWWVRLRARLVGECFAVVGIAAGVALLFASQVSSQSLQSSVGQLSRGIVGSASLQLLARDPHGFPESTLTRVREVPGVRAAAPLLEAGANAIGPAGSESIELIGAQESLGELGGSLVRRLALETFGGVGGVVLTAPLARRIGVTKFGKDVTLELGGQTVRAPLYETVSAQRIGALAASPVAVAPLEFVQEVTGLQGRVSRILVVPRFGTENQVRAALSAIAGGRLNVQSTDYDEKLFSKAATAANQSTQLFAVISALVGFLFAFNAMLLTVPQRRRLIADLRRDGYTPQTVIGVLLLDAIVLGVVACVLGLALGDELSIHVLHSDPAFLSLAFAIGSQRVVTWQSVAIATGGGMLAAIVAVLSPLRDVLSRDPLAAIAPREQHAGAGMIGGPPTRLALAGVVCLTAATLILLVAPDAAIPGMVLLLAALLLVLPFVLGVALALVRRCARMITSAVPHVAVMELSAGRARAVAIAATGAIAVFGSVAIQGAHGDLLKGLEDAAHELNASTDVWVAPAGDYNLLDTTPFAPTRQTQLERLPGVRAVRLYRSGLLDWGQRRVLVIAPPSEATPLIPPGQLLEGNTSQATARVRAGGWLILSQALASEHHLHIGQALELPTPNPMMFRIAGLSTNVGWVPGAIIMNATDYAHAWASQDASAYNVVLTQGTRPAVAAREIRGALGPQPGLSVQTAQTHTAKQIALSRQALANLSQIATLILIVAILAMAAAIGAMIWQRRPRLAKLKLEGLPRTQLWHTILIESLILLATGCLTGAAYGLYGQQLADRALAQTINFPVTYSLTPLTALSSLTLVIAAALTILAIPGYLAASVPAALALQD
jgi:putative ABC transport system permease protein